MASDQAASSGGFLDALKKAVSPLVGFDEAEPQPAPTNYKTARVAGSYVAGTAYDPDMLAALSTAIMARKTPYTALLDSAKKLEKVIPDETMRIKAAFATLGDRTPPDVIQAIDVHLADLEGERLRFKQTSEKNLKSVAGAARSTAKSKEDQIASNAERIQRIRDEAAQLEQANATLTNDARTLSVQADQAESEVKAVEGRFNATVDYLKSDLIGKKSGLGSLLS